MNQQDAYKFSEIRVQVAKALIFERQHCRATFILCVKDALSEKEKWLISKKVFLSHNILVEKYKTIHPFALLCYRCNAQYQQQQQ